MAALSLSWCHTFAFGGILVVVCAPLLVTVGAADTNSLETAVRDAATEYGKPLRYLPGPHSLGKPLRYLPGPHSLGKPYISQLISQPCGFELHSRGKTLTTGSVPPTGDPVSI